MWFAANNLIKHPIIPLADLRGYVLPHAGTAFTGGIISHTLRFRPVNPIKKVVILYYPVSKTPDVDNTYYHEYYVPWQSMVALLDDPLIQYQGHNITNAVLRNSITEPGTIIVVSADFSHFLPFQTAIEVENKAARSLMFKEVDEANSYVDDMKTFHFLYQNIPPDWQLQWIGRERSPGEKAVGYLTFLLREMPASASPAAASPAAASPAAAAAPDGLFVTVYSNDMVARECLGKWFDQGNGEKWSKTLENALKDKVIRLGETTSRLTGHRETGHRETGHRETGHRETGHRETGIGDLEHPLTHYTITYLYRDTKNAFIRGWHGLLYKAFYLPDVFLENTFNNGTWITSQSKTWPPTGDDFRMDETLQHLNRKAGMLGGSRYKKTKRKKNKSKGTKNMRRRRYYNKKGGANNMGANNSVKLYSSKVVHYNIKKIELK